MVIKGHELKPLNQSNCFDKCSFSAGLLGIKLEHSDNYSGECWYFTDKKHKSLTEIQQGAVESAKGNVILFRYYGGSFCQKGYCKIEDEKGCPYVLRFSFSVQVCEHVSFYNAMAVLSLNPAWKNKAVSMRGVWEGLDLGPAYPKHLGETALEYCDSSAFERQFKRIGEEWLNKKLQSKGLGVVPGSLEGSMEIDEYLRKKKELEKKLEELKK